MQFQQLLKPSETYETQNTETHLKRPELMGFVNSLSHSANLETSNDIQALVWISHIFSDPKGKKNISVKAEAALHNHKAPLLMWEYEDFV